MLARVRPRKCHATASPYSDSIWVRELLAVLREVVQLSTYIILNGRLYSHLYEILDAKCFVSYRHQAATCVTQRALRESRETRDTSVGDVILIRTRRFKVTYINAADDPRYS
ncbi:hypothetical protein CYMTET_56280 [Cymbomonas tetramitiformis]|uniref:Uncharacterized protein n=1 Tax=Cymbomonas tetramitiformis TaxID=36881 RepID=A0AAE0BD05_9CHLO|nr:hypothetical protein CYMTET_56280 [Cymbomonas tetramitiformis]